MIIFGNCLLKVPKLFQNIHATNKSSIKIFVNETLHIKPINNKKQLTKPNTDEFKYEDDTEASAVAEIENETEGDDDDDDDDRFNDNDDDDDNSDDGGDVEINGVGDSDGNDVNRIDGVTANGNVSNIQHLFGKTKWCILKQTTLETGEEITFTFWTTTKVSCILDLIDCKGISTQFTEIHVDKAILQTS